MSYKSCPVAHWFLSFGSACQTLGLALMVGGMLALGAFTAPIVFAGLSKELAATLMARIFTRFDSVLLIALALTLLGEVLRVSAGVLPVKSKLNGFRWLLLILLTTGLLFSTQSLNPQIARLNRAGVHRGSETPAGREFDGLHRHSETVYKLELMAALLLLLVNPFLKPLPTLSILQKDY
jgi:hypothetical protein